MRSWTEPAFGRCPEFSHTQRSLSRSQHTCCRRCGHPTAFENSSHRWTPTGRKTQDINEHHRRRRASTDTHPTHLQCWAQPVVYTWGRGPGAQRCCNCCHCNVSGGAPPHESASLPLKAGGTCCPALTTFSAGTMQWFAASQRSLCSVLRLAAHGMLCTTESGMIQVHTRLLT